MLFKISFYGLIQGDLIECGRGMLHAVEEHGLKVSARVEA